MDDNVVRLAELQQIADGEDAIALAFADRHANELRYVAKWGQWLCHDGTRWLPDETIHTYDKVRHLCREVAHEQGRANATTAAKTVAAVERLAKSDRRVAATVDQWDADCRVLNADNATYDLRTGTGRQFDPGDYITKKTACACAPRGTPHPLWDAFLERVTAGDDELQAFLQRYVGYCCTGNTGEHRFVFAYGTGANGKSTFVNTISGIMGDYATTAAMSTFIASNTEQHPTDMAKLCGVRLAVAQETEKGRHWDEAKIKMLTGGDKVAARYMRQDFFDFVPQFKLFISGNHKPQMRGVDEATRRRLLLVPFTVKIPAAERDKDLPDKLRTEWPAILRWMVDGCLEWQRVGLAPPKFVLDATDEYFSEQDTVGEWFDERVEDGGALAFTRTAELFSSWKSWCEDRNLRPGTAKALSEALRDRGCEKRRNTVGQQGFSRLTLKRA